MRRETTNKIRYVLEEWVPPILRDSRFMRVLFRQPWGHITDDFEQLRVHITEISPDDYRHVYERMPRLQEDTDNSQGCLDEIAARAIAGKICDVGCGTGYLIRFMSQQPALANSQFWGADFIVDDEVRSRHPAVKFVAAPIEHLPFADRQFDTVVCTHVLEHILDIRAAISELRRVCNQRLIIVVPLEREYRFSFNPHIHFFPYPHSFLRHIVPVPPVRTLKVIGRDLLYVEDRTEHLEPARENQH